MLAVLNPWLAVHRMCLFLPAGCMKGLHLAKNLFKIFQAQDTENNRTFMDDKYIHTDIFSLYKCTVTFKIYPYRYILTLINLPSHSKYIHINIYLTL